MHAALNGRYDVANIAVDNTAVVTNQVPSGLNRGFGGPQFYFPLERMMDKSPRASSASMRSEIAAAQCRRAPTNFPYDTAGRFGPRKRRLPKAHRLALEQAGYRGASLQKRDAARASEGRKFGIGIALARRDFRARTWLMSISR